ncbi:cysteine-rich CWC family protein [Rivibacter subsaxonicus]|uniref:cysteine-rich CWC family protein n=1 Tax=Rivibacter subsaxonicus TaxID=457575 RepID=UPI00102C1D3B|nr:cysteine-rich CWC family protein [Rivibacter subsaxonicus]
MAGQDRQHPGRGGGLKAPLPAYACPVCGGPNGCAPAASGSFESACWCASLRIAPAVLDVLPPAQRGAACLCRDCATREPC